MQVKHVLTLSLFLVLSLFNNGFAQTSVSGNVSGTWTKANSPYLIIGSVTIPAGQTLTIQPGVEVRSRYSYDQIVINGSLVAKGTATDSVRFVGLANPSYSSASTHGGRLSFENGSTNSQLEYVVMDRWGDTQNFGSAAAAIYANTGVSSLSIARCSIRNSEGAGILINASGVSVTNSSVTNNGSTGIGIETVSISPVVSSVLFTANGKAMQAMASSVGGLSNLTNADVELRNNATATSCTIPKPGPGSYYTLQAGGFPISASTVTTIQPGAEVRSLISYDQITVNGTLVAKGTAADSIRFVGFANPSYSSGSTHGGRLSFENGSAGSELEYVVMDRWGDTQNFGSAAAAIYANTGVSSLSIARCSIRNSEGAGILINASGVSVTNSSVTNNGSTGIGIETVSISPVVSSVLFTANGKAMQAMASSVGGLSNLTNADVELRNNATATSCTIPKPGPGSYYTLQAGGFPISASTVTTIQPGAEVRSLISYDQITVNGTLVAKGTAADSIRFVGFANPSYSSGSTHGGRLSFENGSAGSELEYVVMDRWGDTQNFGGAAAAIYANTGVSSLSISKSTIRNSEGAGIRIEPVSVSPLISQVKFAVNGKDISAPASSVGGLSNLTNADIELRNNATTTSCTVPKPGPGSYYTLQAGGFPISASTVTTIQAGAEVRSLYSYDQITVNGTLVAKGTAADSIRFVGFANPSYSSGSTHGGRLSFENGSAGSELEYVAIDRWGDTQNFGSVAAAIYANTGVNSLSISKSTIRNSEGAGIRIEPVSVSPLISQVKFAVNGKDISAPASSVGGLSNLTNADIELRNNATTTSCTIPKPGPGSYYTLQAGGFPISASTVTTIQPGAEIRSRYYYDQISVNGTLVAKGTAADSIRFVGFADPGFSPSTHGGRLSFENGSAGSELEYVVVDRWGETYGYGSAAAAIYTSTGVSSVSISKSTIRNSKGAGIRIEPVSVSPLISQVKFAVNGKDISAPASSVGGLSNLTNADIELRNNATTTSCTIPKPGPGSYYTLQAGGFPISASTVTTIQPGAEIRSRYYYDQISVNGTLVAKGTAADSIRFVGFADPGFSPSTHGGRLSFENGSAGSELEYVVVDRWGETYGYGSAAAAIYTSTGVSSVSISKSTIRNSKANGIYNAGSPTIAASNIYGNPTGIYNVSGKPVLQNNKIYSNPSYGINNVSSDTVDARNTYWGTPTGPLHPTLNPDGTGNKVSDKVLFVPWIEQLIQVEQTIDFPQITDKFVDDTLVLTATATSNLPVSFTINSVPTTGVAVLNGTTITFPGTVGQVTVVAGQAGNEFFKPAQVQRTFNVSKRNQTISFATIPTKTVGDEPFSLTATATSGLPVSFSVLSGPATLAGTIMTLTGAGTVVVDARQIGNRVFNPATAIQQSFVVLEKRPDLAVKNVNSDRTAVGLSDVVTVSWAIANEGIAASVVNWTERIYLQSPTGGNRTFIKQVSFSNSGSLAPGQSIARSDTLTIPAQLLIGDQAVFVVEILPSSSIQEIPGTQANNIAVQPTAWTIKKELSLALSAGEITEGNTVGISATVRRTGLLTDPLTVAVSLSNVARFTYPTSVDIPAGQSAVLFTIAAPDNNTIDGRVTDQVQVSATGYQAAQRQLVIVDNDMPSLAIVNLPVSTTEGQTVTFKVTTNLAPSSPLSVFLQSSNPARFPVPASVTIAAGALSVDVPVNLAQDNIPEIDLAVILSAGASNHTPATDTIQVRDDDLPNLELVIQTNTLSESAGPNATQATLRRTASSSSIAFTANLSASLPNTLLLPGAISLAEGENEKTFTIGVVDNTLVDGQRQVIINASLFVASCGCNAPAGAAGSVSAVVTVNDDDGPSLMLTVAQQTLPEGFANAGLLRVTRNTATTEALSVTLTSSDVTEATLPATGVIPAGQGFVDVPITTIDDDQTDGNQQVYFTASANGLSSGSIWVIVTDLNKSDLQIPLVQLGSNIVQAGADFTYQVSVKNSGAATAPAGTLIRGYLSTNNVIDASDQVFSEDLLGEAIPAGQTKILSRSVKAPNAHGSYKLLFWANPDATLTELLLTNNVSEPVNFTVDPAYTATATVASLYFLKGTNVPITGSATKTNGSPAATVPVEVYVITNGIRRTLSDTTDASGNFSVPFVPLPSEAGHYIVGASFPGLNQTIEQDGFDILGVRINGGNNILFTAPLNETLSGSVPVENLSNKSLNNFTLSPITLPNGATIQFATLPSLAGKSSATLGYTIKGSVLTSGNDYEIVNLQAKSDEGILQNANAYYYCQAPNAYIVADISRIQASVSQSSGERQIEVKLINKGKGATGNITINLPNVNWLTSVTPKTLPSMAPGDTAVAVLKFIALGEVPLNSPINGSIGINAANGNSLSIPFTFQKVSESSGTARITVTNQFTFYTNNGPKVKDALVKITNYFTGAVYAQGYTNAEGVFVASNVPEGKHRITVEKEKHLPYTNVLEVNPGITTESTVFLNYQAITFSWSVVPTTVQDQYEVVLESRFETNVPVPVVTMEMPKVMPKLSDGQTYPFKITLTNHGLITAEEVTLSLPTTDSEYEFITNYSPSDLLARQSIQIPVVMRRRGPSGGRLSANSEGGSCAGFTGIAYTYECNTQTGLWDRVTFPFIYEGRCGSGSGSGAGGGGITAGQYAALYDAWAAGMAAMGQAAANILCFNCSGSGVREDGGIVEPAPEVEQPKKSCVECIADVAGAVAGCIPGGDELSPLICYLGVAIDGTKHDKGKGLAKCAVDEIVGGIEGEIKDRIAKKVPGLGLFFCIDDILDELEGCKNTESSNGRVKAGELPTAAFNEISVNLRAALNGYKGLRGWMFEYFGDMIDKEGWTVLYPKVRDYLDNLTPIPTSVQSDIMTAMAGYDVPSSALSAFFIRWNTSLEALSNNLLAPNAAYPNIINWNKVDSNVVALVQAHNHSVNKGFKTIGDMHRESIDALNEIIDGQKNEVCASVVVRFTQQLTMTREAFEGTLEIFNGHPTDAMKTISVNIQITDQNGTPSNGLFEIQPQSPANLNDINAQQKGSVKFLFIPELGAAPQTSKVYKFGGSVTYWDPYAQAAVTIPLVPVSITVNPSPSLMLHYFMERNILGDDALTSPEIEPSVPAELAVMVENKGYGPAVGMKISSAQPEIVDNEKGLAISFNLIGSNLQGKPVQLGLMDIDFGTIDPLKTRIGQWYFTSSLLGKFVSYDAKVVHKSSFGNKDLSLVQGVKLHELTKSIKLYGELEDGINDFLVNDVFDVSDRPDIIYFSQGNTTAKVSPATSGSFSSPVSAPTFTNTLTVTPSEAGFNYIKLNDPGNRLFELVSVTRSDGQVIPLDNAWLTFVTLPVSRSPIYENKFHIVDRFTSVAPATYTVVWKPKDINVPKIDSIAGTPTQVSSTQVKNLKVYFNKRIDPATFTYEDLTLTLQGGQNLINSSVIITQIDTAAFNVDLSAITTENGLYTFTAQAANVKDLYGISGTSGKQVSWSQFLDVISITGLKSSYCSNATSQTLVGVPSGGTFSGPGISGNVFDPKVAGVGSHIITYSKDGRSVSDTTKVDLAPSVSISPSSATLTCASPTLSLSAIGADSLRWSTGATSSVISVTVVGVYSVTALSSSGCSGVASTTVSGDASVPVITLVNNGPLSCSATSVTLTVGGGGTGATYRFSAGATQVGSGPTATVSVAGVYSVTALTSSGCTAVASTTVSGDATLPVITLVNNGPLSCSATSVTLTAGGAGTGASYTFSTGATQIGSGPTATVSVAGVYSVTALTSSGCTAVASTTVTGDASLPVVSLVNNGPLSCSATSVTLTAGGAGAGASYTFSAGAVQVGSGPTATVRVAGVYSVTALTSSGCTAVASTTVTGDATIPVITLANNGPLSCSATSVSLTANGAGAGATYRFSPGATQVGSGPTATVSVAGVYSVTALTSSGCSAVASTTVTGTTALPTVSLANDGPLSCAKPTVTLVASSTTGGTYAFQGPQGTISSTANTASVSAAGTYTVTLTSSGCTGVASTTVSGDASVPVITLINNGPLSCSTTSVTLTAGGAGSGASYTFSAGATQIGRGPMATLTVAGVYSVTVLTGSGCTAVASTTVTGDATLPVITLINNGPLSCSATSVTLTAGGAGTGASYTFSAGAVQVGSGPTATVRVAGVYSVTALTSSGCTAVASTTVTGDATIPVITLANNGPLSCSATSVSLTANGAGAGATYRFSPGATQVGSGPTATVSVAGVYSVTALTASGCSAVASTTVSGDATVPVITLVNNGPLSCSATSVTLTAGGAGTGATYRFSPGATQVGSGPTATVSVAGVYSVTALTASGCSAVASTTVSGDATVPVITLVNNGPLSCSATSVTLTAGGAGTGASYRFSTGATQIGSGPTATVSVAGVYSVTALTSSGCTAVASTTVSGDATLPVITLVNNGPLSCSATSVTLTAGGAGTGATYRFSAGATQVGSGPTATVSVAGVYSVTALASSGCSGVASTTVTGDATVPVITLTNNGPISCSATSVTLTADGGGNGATYRFSPGAVQVGSGPTATVTTAGVYSVTALTSSGCSAVASTTVTGDATVPTVTLANNGPLSCSATSVTLTAGGAGAGASYRFSQGATQVGSGPSATVSVAGVYSVTVLTLSGCTAVASTTVNGDATLPTITLVNNGPLSCSVTSVTLTAGGAGVGATYRFSTGATQIGSGPTATLTVAGVYSVTALTSSGCSAVASTTVTGTTALPTVSLVNDGPLSCAKPTVTLVASSTTGGTYAFQGPQGTISSTANTASVSAAGTYTVTLTSNGCSATASTTVTGDASVPVITLVNNGPLSCSATSVTLTAGGVGAGGSYTFSAGATQIGSGPTATVSVAGVYLVTALTSSGCSAVASTTVTGDATVPVITLVNNGPLSCSATSVTLTAGGAGAGAIYTFSTGATPVGSGPTATVSVAGVYSVTALASSGCSGVASTTVTGDATIPVITLVNNGPLSCSATSVTLTAGGAGTGASYRFSTGATQIGSGPTATVRVAGVYSVTALTSSGCTAVASTTVTGDATIPVITLANNGPLSCSAISVTLTAGGVGAGASYTFSTGATQVGSGPTATVSVAGVYSVTALTSSGCTAVASTTVTGDATVPTVTLANNGPLSCSATSVTLTAGGAGTGATYRFSPGATQVGSGPTATVSVAGVYSVTALTSSGCSAVASTTVTGDASVPVVTLINNGPLSCSVTSVTLTAGGAGAGASYTFSAGATQVGSGPMATVSVAGVYSVTALTSSGCTAVASTTVSGANCSFTITGVNMLSCETVDPTRGQRRISFTPQYAGQNGQAINFSVVNELAATTTAGPYTLTLYTDNPVIALKAVQAGTPTEASFNYNWLSACSGTPPVNTPPTVVTMIPNQTAIVGRSFSYSIAAGTFTDAQTPNQLVLSVSGLPASMTFTGPATISGTPSVTGSTTVTVTATDPGSLSVSTTFVFMVLPANITIPFAITGVNTLSCETVDPTRGQRRISFTPQYAGQNGQAINFSVVNELAATTTAGPYTLTLYTDNPVIALKAVQAGTPTEASFNYNWLSACSGTPPVNTPPTVVTMIPNQTAIVGRSFSYSIAAGTFTDAQTPNQLVLSVSGLPASMTFTGPATISGTPSVTGSTSVTVTATDPGSLSVSTTFVLTVLPANTTMPFAITGVNMLSCETVDPARGQRRISFTPQYAGQNGQAINFSVVNELAATTTAGPYTLTLYTDNPVIALKAVQAGTPTEASFNYNWLSACGSARISAEPTQKLSVLVLGSPTTAETVDVEIRGITGQAVQLRLVDTQGRSLSQTALDRVGKVERLTIRLGKEAGFYLLQVSTLTQKQVVKIMKL